MKIRRTFLISLFVLLLVIGIPTGMLVREYRREQATRDLIAAVKAQDIDRARLDLHAGADPNLTGEDLQVSPLMLAGTQHVTPSFRLLLKRGADVHQKDKSGWTPLHWTNFGGDSETAELLIEAGANIEEKRKHGGTPLHLAGCSNNLATAEVLLRHHANVNVRDNWGRTPLDEAWSSYMEGIDSTRHNRFIERLEKAGAKTVVELEADQKHGSKQ